MDLSWSSLLMVLVLSGCGTTPEVATPEAGAAGPGVKRTLHPTLEMFRPLLGLTLEEAREYVETHEVFGPTTDMPGQRILMVRAVVIDGEDQPATMDHSLGRVNVELEQGVIVDVFQPG